MSLGLIRSLLFAPNGRSGPRSAPRRRARECCRCLADSSPIPDGRRSGADAVSSVPPSRGARREALQLGLDGCLDRGRSYGLSLPYRGRRRIGVHPIARTSRAARRKAWGSGARERSSITLSNYTFEDPGAFADGLAKLSVTPRRKDSLLVNGAIFVKPGDGDLVRMEGQLAKAPSFWTRRVEIVRRCERFHGVRLPVALESVANVLIYGRASLTMTYEYESVNGQRVGTVQLHAAGGPAHP